MGVERETKLEDRLRALATTPDGLVVEPMLDTFRQVVSTYNGPIHGDPTSASFSLEVDEAGGSLFLAAKDLKSPRRAETLCFNTHLFLLLMTGRVATIFPELTARGIRPYVGAND